MSIAFAPLLWWTRHGGCSLREVLISVSGADGVGYVWEVEGAVVEPVRGRIRVVEDLRLSTLGGRRHNPVLVCSTM